MKIIEWLLDSDVSVQYQVHRDLIESNDKKLKELQSRIELEGFGERLLLEKHNEGFLGKGYYSRKWISLHYTLYDLYFLGINPTNKDYVESTKYLIEKLWFNKGWVRKNRMQDLCVAAMILSMATYAKIKDERLNEIVDYIIEKIYPDGGWNCQWYLGDKVSSLDTTLTTLEAFNEYIINGYTYRVTEIKKLIPKAQELLLKKELYLRETNKEVIRESYLNCPFPPRWHYDVLRALDYFRNVNYQYDSRMSKALEYVESRHKNGIYQKYSKHGGLLWLNLDPGKGSKWNTLRTLRVLKKYRPEHYNEKIKKDID